MDEKKPITVICSTGPPGQGMTYFAFNLRGWWKQDQQKLIKEIKESKTNG